MRQECNNKRQLMPIHAYACTDDCKAFLQVRGMFTQVSGYLTR